VRPTKGTKSGKPSQNGKEELKNTKKLTKLKNFPKRSQCKLPLDRHYHVSSLNHPISKNSTNFVHNLFPFGNELIKHNLREE
jgi:hypothetical protein